MIKKDITGFVPTLCTWGVMIAIQLGVWPNDPDEL